eukprot:g55786.t1
MGEPNEVADQLGEINLAGGGFWKPWGELEIEASAEIKNPKLVRIIDWVLFGVFCALVLIVREINRRAPKHAKRSQEFAKIHDEILRINYFCLNNHECLIVKINMKNTIFSQRMTLGTSQAMSWIRQRQKGSDKSPGPVGNGVYEDEDTDEQDAGEATEEQAVTERASTACSAETEPEAASNDGLLDALTPLYSLSRPIEKAPCTVKLYLQLCETYHRTSNPGVVVALRYRARSIMPASQPVFSDADLVPLADLFLLKPLSVAHAVCLDFSRSHLRSHGAIVLAHMLSHPQCAVKQLYLDNNQIGPHGAKALAQVFKERANHSLTRLSLRGNAIKHTGAEAWAQALSVYAGQSEVPTSQGGKPKGSDHQKAGAGRTKTEDGPAPKSMPDQPQTRLQLKFLDASVNMIGWHGVHLLEQTQEKLKGSVKIRLDDNLVFPEVMSSITHGLGILFSIFASWYMLRKVLRNDEEHPWVDLEVRFWSCLVYCFTLLLLYFSSTFYHVFFMTDKVRHVFGVLDHCAIYLLIAGSYTPFMCILLGDKPYALWLLVLQWTCCIVGIFIAAINEHGHERISLFLYVVMGWACIGCGNDMFERLHPAGLKLLVAGGVAYTGGIPFFVLDKYMFHAIWHVFVLAGSVSQYLAIFLYML